MLDDLDKELNNYIMRCRDWYGWHFLELGKIITDNLAFVKTVELMGIRENAKKTLYEAKEKKGFTVLENNVSKTLEHVMERVF